MTPTLYLAGGLALVAALAGAWGALERAGRLGAQVELTAVLGQKEAAERALAQVRAINAANQAALDRLVTQRAEDARRLDVLAGEKAVLEDELEDVRAMLREVESTDDEVRSYLRSPIPERVLPYVNRPTRGRGPVPDGVRGPAGRDDPQAPQPVP